jgi:hypothetical protein
LKRIVRLKPGLRRGELKVEDLSGNQAMNADVRIKNLDKADEPVNVESTTKGGYSFTLRKNDRYSLSILKKGYMYFHTVWQPDESGVRQALTVRLVPLNQVNRIEMGAMRFDADTTEFSPESLSELDCMAAVMRGEPGVRVSISIPSDGSVREENAAEKLMRMIGYYLISRMVSQSQYSIEKAPRASAAQLDGKEEIRPFIQFVERRR